MRPPAYVTSGNGGSHTVDVGRSRLLKLLSVLLGMGLEGAHHAPSAQADVRAFRGGRGGGGGGAIGILCFPETFLVDLQ